MKITNISASNIGLLSEYLQAFQQTNRNRFPTNLNPILSRISIRCDLTDINFYEFMCLKRMSSNVYVMDEYTNDGTFLSESDPFKSQLQLPIEQTVSLFNKLYYPNLAKYMLPVGCTLLSCIITFRGNAILNTFGDLRKMFTVGEGYTGILEDWIEDYIANCVINKLFEQLPEYTYTKDLVTSSWLNYQYESKLVSKNRLGVYLNRVFKDTGEELLLLDHPQPSIDEFKSFKDTNPDAVIYMEFICNTPIYALYHLMLCIRNFSYIIDMEEIQSISAQIKEERLMVLGADFQKEGFQDFDYTSMKLIGKRFLEVITEYQTYLKENELKQVNKEEFQSGKYEVKGITFDSNWLIPLYLLPANTQISYSIIAPMDQLFIKNFNQHSLIYMDSYIEKFEKFQDLVSNLLK